MPGPLRDKTGAVKKKTDRSQASKASKPYDRSSEKELFQDSWLELPQFKPWLEKRMEPSYGDYKAYCVVCDDSISNHKSVISKHSTSKKHTFRAPMYETILKQREQLESFTRSAKKEEVVEYEMVLCTLIAQKNLPICLVEELVEMNRRLHPKDEVLPRVRLGRTKAGSVIRDGNLTLGKVARTCLYLNTCATGYRIWKRI